MPAVFRIWSELDPAAWEVCLAAAAPATPYGHWAWLRAVANGRVSAIVWESEPGTYDAVLPLPERRKAFILPYVAMPPFTQRLGLYARPGQDAAALATDAARLLRRRYLRTDLALDDERVARILSGRITPRQNRVLDLTRPLPDLEAGLGKSIRQKLKEAARAGLTLTRQPTALTPFRFIRDCLQPRLPGWDKWYDFAWARLSIVPGAPFIVEGWLAQLGTETVAAAVFVRYRDRIIYLAGASTDKGLATGATAALIWEQVRQNAAHPTPHTLLDFEGGSLSGTRQFFSMFGTGEELYYSIRM